VPAQMLWHMPDSIYRPESFASNRRLWEFITKISPLAGIIKGGLVYDSAATYRDKIWI
jgi:hypothetical protein